MTIILAELARNEPQAFGAIVQSAGLKFPARWIHQLRLGDIAISTEWWLPRTRRRADLALYIDPAHPLLLIEIKDEDGKLSHTDQLSDYIEYVEQSSPSNLKRTEFLLLSRYLPFENEQSALDQAASKALPVAVRRHSQVYDALDNSSGPITRMVREYLEDVGMSYRTIKFDDQNLKSLMYLTTRMLGMPRPKGVGSTSGDPTVRTIPSLMNIFFENLEVLGNWVHASNRKVFSQSFRRHFLADPEFDIPRHRFRPNQHDVDLKRSRAIDGISVVGGSVYFYAEAAFRCPKKTWAGVDFGYWIYYEPGSPALGLYVNFWWRNSKQELAGLNLHQKQMPSWESRTLTNFPNESSAQQALSNGLRIAQSNAVKLAPKIYGKVFENFIVP